MKNIPSGLDSTVASETATLATLWRVTRTDGTILRFTDHDENITYGSQVYYAKSGYTPTNISMTEGMSVDNLQIEGILDSEFITEDDMARGLYDYATVEIMLINYQVPGYGVINLRKGTLGELKSGKTMYYAELRGLTQQLNQAIGRVYTYNCDADLGDSRCKVSLGSWTVTGVVTSKTSNSKFKDNTTANIINKATGWFDFGLLTWLTGNNAGGKMEVKYFTAPDTIELQEGMWNDITVGDTFTVVAGCDRSPTHCKTKFNNYISFQGFPQIPNPDTVFTYR